MPIDSINKIWFLEKFDLIKELPLEVREKLDRCGVVHRNFKKEVVYFEDSTPDLIYFLKNGRVKISKISSDGKETTLYIVQAGEIFGEMSLMGGEKMNHRAEALDEILLCSFRKQDFADLLSEHPELSRRVYKRIGERLQIIEQKLADLVFKSAEERIISFLLEVAKPYLNESINEAYIKPFFTHEEVAHLTATSRQTVTTLLNELKKDELIKFWRNKLYVMDYTGLKRYLKAKSSAA